jgi:hypothetical protein
MKTIQRQTAMLLIHRQDKQVKEHLIKQKENKKIIKEILNKEPQEFKQEMKDVIAEQRANGLWK